MNLHFPLLRRPKEIDFPVLIGELVRNRSRSCIAFSLARAESTLRRWEEGSMPNYEDGRALVQLYVETFGTQAPVKVEARLDIANAFA